MRWHSSRSGRFFAPLSLFLVLALPAPGPAATTASLRGMAPQGQPSPEPTDSYTTRTLADFLPTTTTAGEEVPGFFNEVPPHLDPAVRYVAEENYTSAAAHLLQELEKHTDERERARIHLWLGLTYGSQAIDYPDYGWVAGTSATENLRKAFEMAPESFEASDAARIMAEMVSHGWARQDPKVALLEAEKKAEQTRRSVDYYYAGVIARRQAQIAWAYSDTSALDRQVLSLMAKATALDPLRYENWAGYLRALMPVGLHDLAVQESPRMFAYFKPLRTPLLYDPGPAATMLSVGAGFDMESEQQFLKDLVKERPDDPYPRYQLALTAIETSPNLAIERFEDFLARVEDGTVKFKPREQGLKVSAMYKLAFLSVELKTLEDALAMYRKVKEISPTYAEVNNNIAAVLCSILDRSTTGSLSASDRIRMLEEALEHVKLQQGYNYRGRIATKTEMMRQRIEGMLRELKGGAKETTGTAAALSAAP